MWNARRSAFVSLCERLLLRRFPRQVGNERGDGADVRDDSEHDGEHGEPQSLARRRVRPLEIPLSRRLVGLGDRREGGAERREEDQREKEGRRALAIVCHCPPWPHFTLPLPPITR